MINDKFTKAQMDRVDATINSDGYYELNIRQMSEILYNNGDKFNKNLATDIKHYTLDIHSDNYAERAFVFGSTKMTFEAKDVKFLINTETFEPEFIDNLQIKPYQSEDNPNENDNFDLTGDGAAAKLANHYLEKLADPSNIGRKVKFVFDDFENIAHQRVGKDEFLKQKAKFEKLNTIELIDTKNAWAKYFNEKILPTGVINYLDENGKLVMHGTNKNDRLVEFQAKNINFSEPLLSELANIKNHYKQHVKNGITYVGGKGSDTIIGTRYDDILYGHDKNGDDDGANDILMGGNGFDKLYGGKGNDTYYVGDKDIIFDSDAKGSVVFEGVTLKGGVYDKDKGVYIDDTDNLITYRINGDDKATLIVQKEGKSLTINNYTKSSKDLGINLANSAVSVLVSDSSAVEANQKMNFNISLDRKLEEKEYLVLRVNDKKFLFGTLPNDSNINQGIFDSISSDGYWK